MTSLKCRPIDRIRSAQLVQAWTDGDKPAVAQAMRELAADRYPNAVGNLLFATIELAASLAEQLHEAEHPTVVETAGGDDA